VSENITLFYPFINIEIHRIGGMQKSVDWNNIPFYGCFFNYPAHSITDFLFAALLLPLFVVY
jgi:hypothetical protein